MRRLTLIAWLLIASPVFAQDLPEPTEAPPAEKSVLADRPTELKLPTELTIPEQPAALTFSIIMPNQETADALLDALCMATDYQAQIVNPKFDAKQKTEDGEQNKSFDARLWIPNRQSKHEHATEVIRSYLFAVVEQFKRAQQPRQ